MICPHCLHKRDDDEVRKRRHFITQEEKTMTLHTHADTHTHGAANRLSQFGAGAFHLASTHSFPRSDHAAAIFTACHCAREDGGVTEVTATKAAVTPRRRPFTWKDGPGGSERWVNWVDDRTDHSRTVKIVTTAKLICQDFKNQ